MIKLNLKRVSTKLNQVLFIISVVLIARGGTIRLEVSKVVKQNKKKRQFVFTKALY